MSLFLVLYAVLQGAYQWLRSSRWDATFIESTTVRPAVRLLGWVAPADSVQAIQARLVWPGGQLTLRAGCDGFEVMCLFVAALLVADVAWRRGLAGLVVGCLAIWSLNQVRIVMLYEAFRRHRDYFDVIHTLWGPLLIISAAAVVYFWVLRVPARRSALRP